MTTEMLKTRTKKFAVEAAKYCEQLPGRLAIQTYSRQLIRSSSAVGANYRSACRAKSLPDFINKLKIVEEEADESIFFMELIAEIDATQKNAVHHLIKEGNEILAIIVASIKTAKKRKFAPTQSTIVNRII